MKRIEMIAQFLNFNKKVFRKVERFRGGCVCSIIEDFRIFRGIDEKKKNYSQVFDSRH